MLHRLTCPQGHRWEMSGHGFADSEAEVVCPVCGLTCATAVRADQTGPWPASDWSTNSDEPHPPANPDLPRLPGYEILKPLGEGAMGVVLLARHLRLNRLVAVKLLAAGARAGPRELARFQIEAETLAALNHPHIVEIYEVGEVDNMPFFALEYVSGGTLAQRLNAQPQPPVLTARLVETLARAIHAAHQHGIIHRDLKPANILMAQRSDGPGHPPGPQDRASDLSGEYVPKVTDFGLAKRLGETTQGETGVILGTPHYMAPEQAAGDPRAVGAPADVYALGVILFEALTGQVPFHGPSTMATLELVRWTEPPPPQRLKPSIPRDLATICLKCLAKEPSRRYPSAEALADDLRRFLNHEPIHARPTPVHERCLKWVRRRPTRAALLGVITLAALLLGLREWSNFREREAARAEARLFIAQIVNDTYTQVAESLLANEPEMDPLRREFLGKALALLEKFVSEEPTNPALRREHGLAHFRVGDIWRLLGGTEEAEKAYRQALALQQRLLAESPGEPAYREDLANTHTWLGELLRTRGQHPEAEQACREALRLQLQLVEEFPDHATYRKELTRSRKNLGRVLQETNRYQDADEQFSNAIASLEQLRKEAPEKHDSHHELAQNYLNRGVLQDQRGRAGDSEKDYDAAIDLLEELVRRFPARPAYRFELALACTDRANLLQRSPAARLQSAAQTWSSPHFTAAGWSLALWLARPGLSPGRLPAAEKNLRQALGLFARLADDFPDRSRYHHELANCKNSLASLCALSWRYEEAEELWRQALDLFAGLVKKSPTIVENRFALGMAYSNLGWLCLKRDQAGRARDWLERGQVHLQDALRPNPKNAKYLAALCNLCQNLAEARVLSGDHPGALDAAARMVQESQGENPNYYYLAACFAARCLEAACTDSKVAQAERAPLKRRYAEQALVWLRQAVRQGYQAVGGMGQDPRLQALRGDPDFTRLLNELQRE